MFFARLFCGFALALLVGGVRAQENWSPVSSPVTQGLWSVAWGGGQFVTVGESGTILTSPDGVAWTRRESGTTHWLVGVTYAQGAFVAVGDQGTILFSYDGMLWRSAETSSIPGFFPGRLNVVRRVLNRFVVAGENATTGVSWGNPTFWNFTPTLASPGNWWRGLAFGQGRYVASGAHGIAATENISALADAPIRTAAGVRDIEDVVFARDEFLAVGPIGLVLHSPDGLAWTPRSAGIVESLRALAFFNNHYVAVGDAARVVTSADGTAWTSRPSGANETLRALGGSADVLVAVGDRGRIVRSTAATSAPTILASPVAQVAEFGGNAVFRVRAAGGPALTYAWLRDGNVISGATDDTLLLTDLQFSDGGAYSARVTTAAGTAISDIAGLTVTSRSGVRPVDDTFTVSSAFTGAPTALLPLADGRVLVAGGRPGELVRLRNDGTLDPTFPAVQVNAVAKIVAMTDGRILIGGDFTAVNGQPRARLVRLMADGTLDPSFNAAPAATTDSISDIVEQPDGKVIVANRTTRLQRLLPNGDVDPEFARATIRVTNTSNDFKLWLVALAPDGKIVVATQYDFGGAMPLIAGVVRLNADGTPDPSFPVRTAGSFPTTLRVLSDGHIAFASYVFRMGSISAFGRSLRRYGPDGTVEFASDMSNLSTVFDLGFTRGWFDVHFYPDGRALVSSDFTTVDGQPRAGLARLNRDGTLDATFQPGVTPLEPVTKLAVAADGKIYAGGAFTVFDGRARPRLARLNDHASVGPHAPANVTLSPAAANVKAGEAFTLRAAATGSGPLTYRWFRAGRSTPFAVTAEPTLAFTPAANVSGSFVETGLYTVQVLNGRGAATSAPIALTVVPAELRILHQPTQLSAQTGRNLLFSVEPNDQATISQGVFEWRRNGVPLPLRRFGRFEIPSVTAADAGTYTVTIHDEAGNTITSAPIVLTVDDTSRLANLSVRGTSGSGERTLIAGFTITADRNRARTVLVRGIGPGLGAHGVPNPVADPRLEIFDRDGRLVASNDNWETGHNATPAQMAAVGAFPLAPGSKDAAIHLFLSFLRVGNYTAHLTGGAGNGLIEIYEADNDAHRLVNLSARAFVGVDSGVTISGIVIRGPVPKKILVRAVGPGLAGFGVQEHLADPVLSLRDSEGREIASNQDWSANAAEIQAAAERVGAFPLAANSRDAALLRTIPPGNYTAIVSGQVGGQGIALVEVYEVP